MELQTITGAVSHCRLVSDTHGQIHARHGGNVRTTHTTIFRVAGHPVEMRGAINVDNGDEVTAVVHPGSSPLRVIGLRDEHSGVQSFVGADTRFLIAGILLLFAGTMCASGILDVGVRENPAVMVMPLAIFAVGGILIKRFIGERNLILSARMMLGRVVAVPARG
jgi:hypothetical protein